MELVVLVGIQGSGKSTFYKERFFNTHVRINLDMFRTRHREKVLFQACLETRQPVVIDNTNPGVEDRARYLGPAKAAGFRAVGYFFQVPVEDCLRRNAQRPERCAIPVGGLLGTAKRLQPPTLDEGFDALYTVTIDAQGGFVVGEPFRH